MRRRPRAQRLTASKVFALVGSGTATPTARVLNALRHQRFLHSRRPHRLDVGNLLCSTPYGIKGFCTRTAFELSFAVRVLNALRHQRFLHIPVCLLSPRLRRVLNALRHQRFLHTVKVQQDGINGASVLNALRHQRFLHPVTGTLSDLAGQCSTPYGIKGFCTYWIQRGLGRTLGCSTPYGIKGFCTSAG